TPAVAFGGTLDNLDAAIEAAGNDIPIVKKSIFLETDIHESRLKAIFQVANFSFENAANEAFFGGAFDVEFLEPSFFENRDTRLKCFGVDDNLFMELFNGLDEPLNFLNQGASGGPDTFHKAPGLLLNRNGLKALFLMDLRRGFI